MFEDHHDGRDPSGPAARAEDGRGGASTSTARGPGSPIGRAALALAAALAVAALSAPAGLAAQEGHGDHDHEHGGDGHHAGLHFTHPMIAESVTPDRKIRMDHQFFEFSDGDQEHSGVLEAEFAVTRGFSVEAGIPFTYTDSEFGNAEVLFKFANFAFEEAGILLGYGVELGFPTAGAAEGEAEEAGASEAELLGSRRGRVGPADAGSSAGSAASASGGPPADPPGPSLHSGGAGVGGTLGSEEWEVAPFLNVGWKSGPVELVGWGVFGIPFNQAEQSEVATELSWNFSGLYHVSSRVQALVELDGSGGISGPTVGEDVVNVSPGVRVQILPDTPLVLGSSVGVPLSNEEPFDVRWKTSVFWHFPR